MGFAMKPLQLKEFNSGNLSMKDEVSLKSSNESAWSRGTFNFEHVSLLLKDIRVLLSDKVYVVNVLGYIGYNFAIGAYLYWVPKAGFSIYKMLLSAATFLGAIFCFTAFCFKSMYAFLALFAIGELLVFATQYATAVYGNVHCFDSHLRDVPSSPLVSVLWDYVNNWRETALILTAIMFLAAGIGCIGIFLKSVDRFNEDSESRCIAED